MHVSSRHFFYGDTRWEDAHLLSHLICFFVSKDAYVRGKSREPDFVLLDGSLDNVKTPGESLIIKIMSLSKKKSAYWTVKRIFKLCKSIVSANVLFSWWWDVLWIWTNMECVQTWIFWWGSFLLLNCFLVSDVEWYFINCRCL